MAHVKSLKPDSSERVQACLAQAAAHQFDPSAYMSVVDLLLRLVDVLCSMRNKTPALTAPKLAELRSLLDGLEQQKLTGRILVPVKRHAGTSATISAYTASVIEPGTDDDAFDHVVITVPSRLEIYGLV